MNLDQSGPIAMNDSPTPVSPLDFRMLVEQKPGAHHGRRRW
jgi:hypothetical protein